MGCHLSQKCHSSDIYIVWGAICLKSATVLIFIYVMPHVLNVDSHM